jgi:hypothetical protein
VEFADMVDERIYFCAACGFIHVSMVDGLTLEERAAVVQAVDDAEIADQVLAQFPTSAYEEDERYTKAINRP